MNLIHLTSELPQAWREDGWALLVDNQDRFGVEPTGTLHNVPNEFAARGEHRLPHPAGTASGTSDRNELYLSFIKAHDRGRRTERRPYGPGAESLISRGGSKCWILFVEGRAKR